MKNQLCNIRKTSDLIKEVESRGYKFSRKNGSHMIYTRDNSSCLSIPDTREIARGTIRNIVKIVESESYYSK